MFGEACQELTRRTRCGFKVVFALYQIAYSNLSRCLISSVQSLIKWALEDGCPSPWERCSFHLPVGDEKDETENGAGLLILGGNRCSLSTSWDPVKRILPDFSAMIGNPAVHQGASRRVATSSIPSPPDRNKEAIWYVISSFAPSKAINVQTANPA